MDTRYDRRSDRHLPAVNVRLYRGLEAITPDEWTELRESVGLPDAVAARFDRQWIESRYGLDTYGTDSRKLERFYEWQSHAASLAIEDGTELARTLFGPGVCLETEGRSGGWLVVHGLPDVAGWDPIAIGGTCPNCGKVYDAIDATEQRCADYLETPDNVERTEGCGESHPDATLPPLTEWPVGEEYGDGTYFRRGTLTADSGLVERWDYFERAARRACDDIPRATVDLIAHNEFVHVANGADLDRAATDAVVAIDRVAREAALLGGDPGPALHARQAIEAGYLATNPTDTEPRTESPENQ